MLKIGVIGYGKRINAMVELVLECGECKLVAIADKNVEQVQTRFPERVNGVKFYTDAEQMLESEQLDGVLVGTRCSSHARYAELVAGYGLPLFLEKPVCTTYEDLARLKALKSADERTVVSFPLRTALIVERVKEIIKSGRIGEISQVQAYNNVAYGTRYYHKWYRDVEETGGMFLQKATHDIDYVIHAAELKPKSICAMKSSKIYGGERPEGLRCADCSERDTCYETQFVEESKNDIEIYDYCAFAKDVGIEDCGSFILECEGDVQVVYTQSFIARRNAAKRGARFIGYKGTVEFDFYTGVITLYDHGADGCEEIRLEDNGSHFGGDKFLIESFIEIMRSGAPSRSPLSGGILSAEICLGARRSSEERVFVDIDG